MDALFMKLLSMSLTAGWLILAVIVLRLFLKKAPRWLSCMLWAIVAVRLICPISFESPLSLMPDKDTIDSTVIRYTQALNSRYGSEDPLTDTTPGLHAPASAAGPQHTLTFIAAAIWITGLAILLGYAFISFLRLRGRMRESVPLQDNVRICDNVKSPFILGIFRPQIYLSSAADEKEIAYILAHEQAHLKRKDHWWKPLGYLLLAVYWFHPLVWVAYILLCRDIELACDEKVIKNMDMAGKKAYSNALVANSIPRKMVMACPLAFGEVGVKERVKTVLNYKKPAFWIVLTAIAVCMIVAACFLTNPKQDSFNIRITIPAHSEQGIYYSDEEISPTRNLVTLSSGEGLGDTAVLLKPTAAASTNTEAAPTYMTPGMPVKIAAEKGAWFKIGIMAGNPTDEDINVYVEAKNVEVRIADLADIENHSNMVKYLDHWFAQADLSDETIEWLQWYNSLPEDTQLTIDHIPSELYNLMGDGNGSDIPVNRVETLEAEDTEENTITFAGRIVENTMDSVKPLILVKPLTAFMDELEYDYICFVLPDEEADWCRQANSLVTITCKNSFEGSQPIYGELISITGASNSPNLLSQDQDMAMDLGLPEGDADTDTLILALLKTICSDPKTSSNPQDYIDAHPTEYGELISYGEDTVGYCFRRFEQGNETGLEGKIMAIVCGEILRAKNESVPDAYTAASGQSWYNALNPAHTNP